MAKVWKSISAAFFKVSRISDKFFLNPFFYALLFALAYSVTHFGKEVHGAVGFVLIICLALVLCGDIFATTLPFLLLCVFVTKCYDSYDTFIKYIWIIVPVAFSLIFHFVVYRKKIQLGATFKGLVAVSVSLVMGGLGYISAADYFRPVSLYYVVFLGIGMIVAYILIKSQMCSPRDYDAREKLLTILYIMGLFACILVFKNIYDLREKLEIYDHIRYTQFQSRNNLSTFIMFALPCPFFFASRNRLHLISPLIMLVSLLLSGSRGGIIFGIVEFILCLILFAVFDKRNRYIYIASSVLAIVATVCFINDILMFIIDRPLTEIINADEARFKLIERAWEGFKANPVFGHGLGYMGNTDLYNPKTGALTWYHMLIPQIVGSLGITGILAYGYQFFLRVKLLIKQLFLKDALVVCALGMSYVGILLMSMVNPGLFCPIPYSLITVIIFALLDTNGKSSIIREYNARIPRKTG